MKKFIAALMIGFTMLASPVQAKTVTIYGWDPGGLINQYIHKYEHDAKSGTKIVLKGYCVSACTLMLGIMPRDKVCVSSGSMFAFHSASTDMTGKVFSEDGSRVAWHIYPESVKRELVEHGWQGPWQPHPDLIWVKATDFYKVCKG